jgi:hypothetical protein
MSKNILNKSMLAGATILVAVSMAFPGTTPEAFVRILEQNCRF